MERSVDRIAVSNKNYQLVLVFLVKEDKTFYQTKPFAGSQFSKSVLM
jgi:hypothetical protein